MPSHRPCISFGVPVYQGAATIRRCLDSLLKQDFDDFEVVVSDNASDDGTRDILREYEARDDRVRVSLNPENIGQIDNCNRVYQLSRGKYFRWVGVSDWLEPRYASMCFAAIDHDDSAIAVSTYYRIHLDSGETRYAEFRGRRVDANDPAARFARMLWFFHAGDANYDPLYSLIRREALERTAMLRMITKADFMLAAELSLIGRFLHVPHCLAHREKPANLSHDSLEICRRYHPTRYRELYTSPWGHLRILNSIIREEDLSPRQRLRCRAAALRFFAIESRKKILERTSRFRRERLGLTREKFRKMAGVAGSRESMRRNER